MESDKCELLERLNENYSHEILTIVQFYGQSPLAQNAHLTSSNHNELTISWDVPTKDGTSNREQSMVLNTGMQLDTTTATRYIQDKAEDARMALVAMASQQPGDMQPTVIEFAVPSPTVQVLVLSGLAIHLILAFVQKDGVMSQLLSVLPPQRVLQLALYVVGGVHLVEAVIMFLACSQLQRLKREYELSDATRFMFTISTLVFGVFAGITLTRQAMKPPGHHAKDKKE
ncbi:hypothetical protein GGI21_002942 [Coemansia aciculifera]|nr:hypothetical protein GGI21_002942 [Coemansia aciculifera]